MVVCELRLWRWVLCCRLFEWDDVTFIAIIACHHWRPNLPGGCCICLEQSAGVRTGIAVTASLSQQTEDRAFCPVVQLLWLRASHCTDYHVTSLLFLRVTCPCSLRTYATLKFIRSSSSSSSSLLPRDACRNAKRGIATTAKLSVCLSGCTSGSDDSVSRLRILVCLESNYISLGASLLGAPSSGVDPWGEGSNSSSPIKKMPGRKYLFAHQSFGRSLDLLCPEYVCGRGFAPDPATQTL